VENEKEDNDQEEEDQDFKVSTSTITAGLLHLSEIRKVYPLLKIPKKCKVVLIKLKTFLLKRIVRTLNNQKYIFFFNKQ